MKRTFAKLAFVLAILFLLTTLGLMDDQTQPNIYIAGYSEDADGIRVPCYWRNGVRVDLSTKDPAWPTVGSTGGTAFAVAVSRNEVVLAGSFFDALGVEKPCQWRNGVASHLPMIDPAKNGDANGVFLANGEVFLSGQLFNAFCAYEKVSWRNEMLCKYKLPMEESGSGAAAVFVDGNDHYLAGYNFPPVVYATTVTYFPCYWKNGVKNSLPKEEEWNQNGFATGIWKDGPDIHLCGYLNNKDELMSSFPSYWLNGALTLLPVIRSGRPGWAWSIQVSGGDVFIAGHCRDGKNLMVPCYWKNGMRLDLKVPKGTHGWARSIALDGVDIYVSGYFQNASDVIVPCYWKNGVLHALPVVDSARNGRAFGIFVQLGV